MKGTHKAICAVAVIVLALFIYHMLAQHAGQGFVPAGLGTK